ncbi:MAG: hypothetical protein ACYC91_14135 [Solirubrobacteraceae bacterium]
MQASEQEQLQRDLDELHAAGAARRERDRQLSMSERLEKVHQLCAQLSELKPVGPHSDD